MAYNHTFLPCETNLDHRCHDAGDETGVFVAVRDDAEQVGVIIHRLQEIAKASFSLAEPCLFLFFPVGLGSLYCPQEIIQCRDVAGSHGADFTFFGIWEKGLEAFPNLSHLSALRCQRLQSKFAVLLLTIPAMLMDPTLLCLPSFL